MAKKQYILILDSDITNSKIDETFIFSNPSWITDLSFCKWKSVHMFESVNCYKVEDEEKKKSELF